MNSPSISHEDLDRHAQAERRRAALRRRRIVRGLGVLVLLAALGGAAYLVLGLLVAFMTPEAPPGGIALPPSSKLLLGVAWYSPVLTALPIVPPLMRRGRERDLRDGLILPDEPAAAKPRMSLASWLIWGLFAAGVLLGAWLLLHFYTVVGPDWIRVQRGSPGFVEYRYDRVRAISLNPTGRVRENVAPDAPSIKLEFDDGRWAIIDTDQGLSLEELERLAGEISARAHVPVRPIGLDAHRGGVR